MKVLFKIAIACSLVLSSAAFVLNYAFSDSLRLEEIEITDYSVPFYISGANVSTDDALEFFENLSSKYNVSIIKTTESINNEKASIKKSGVFSIETFPINQLGITSGNFPSDPDGFLSTNDSGDSHQSGVLYDFGGDDQLTIGSLEREYSEKGHIDGIYSIESTASYDRSIVNEIATFFLIDEVDLLEQTSFKAHGINGLFYVALVALGLLLLLTVLINVMTPITNLKLINSQKLLGWSNFSIWLNSIKGSIVLSIIIACLILFITYLIPGWSGQFFVGLLVVQILTLILMISISTVSLFAIMRIKAVEALKGASAFRLSLIGAVTLKILFTVCISISSVPIAQNVEIIIKNYETRKYWLEYGDYYVISQFNLKDDDVNSLLTGDPMLSDKFAALYDGLNNELGAVYVRSIDYPENLVANNFANTYQTLIVNPNYLERHPILDTNGNQFNFSENEKGIILLIPKSRETEIDKFVEQAKSDWLFDEQSMRNRYGETSNSDDEVGRESDEPEVSFYIYDDSHQFFSFHEQVASENEYLLKSPLVKVVTLQNIQQSEKWNIQETGLSSPIKLPALSDENKSVFYEIAYQCGFVEGSIFIDTSINCIASEIAQSQNSMNNLVLVFIALLFLCVISSFALIHIILISRNRWLNVARYLGYSLLARHWQTILFVVGVYTLCTITVWLITDSTIACAVILCAAVLDVIICALVLWRLEKKNTALLLKGQ